MYEETAKGPPLFNKLRVGNSGNQSGDNGVNKQQGVGLGQRLTLLI